MFKTTHNDGCGFLRHGPKLSTPRSKDRCNPRLTFNSLQRQGRGRAIGKTFPVDFPEHSLHLCRLHHGNRTRTSNFEFYHEQQFRSSNGDLGWGSQSLLFKYAPTRHPPPPNPVGTTCLLKHSTAWHPLHHPPRLHRCGLGRRGRKQSVQETRGSEENRYTPKGGTGLSSTRHKLASAIKG